MKEGTNLKCYKRSIYKQLLQLSGLCSTPFLSNLPKLSTQIFRAQYGDAILVSQFFQTVQLCHGAILMLHTAETFKILFKMFYFKNEGCN